jgi:electron transfer flavoprotein alpha subunit
METILFLAHAEPDNAPLRRHQLEALAAAKQLAADLGADLHAGLLGADVSAISAQLAGCGATRVLGVSGAEFDSPRYASDAAAAEAICKASGATIVVAPATSRWNRVLPGVSQRLGGRSDSHVTQIDAEDGVPTATRWVYRQRIETKLRRACRPWLLAVESGIAPAFQPTGDAPAVESVDLAAPASRTRVTGIQSPAGDQQTIRPDAEILFVTGAGWTKKQPDGTVKAEEASQLILDFLEKSRASLGSTKSLVDMGEEGEAVLPFLSHMNQVGQTGSTPRHQKGLATCCHGEEPHTVGWRFINERRAISLDAACGWSRGKADILYVADAFEVMRELNALLQ